jgi:RNA recognition motif-containing protein
VHHGQVFQGWASNFASTISCQVRLVHDKDSKKPRGYAFIEYQHTRDMKSMPIFLFLLRFLGLASLLGSFELASIMAGSSCYCQSDRSVYVA